MIYQILQQKVKSKLFILTHSHPIKLSQTLPHENRNSTFSVELQHRGILLLSQIYRYTQNSTSRPNFGSDIFIRSLKYTNQIRPSVELQPKMVICSPKCTESIKTDLSIEPQHSCSFKYTKCAKSDRSVEFWLKNCHFLTNLINYPNSTS